MYTRYSLGDTSSVLDGAGTLNLAPASSVSSNAPTFSQWLQQQSADVQALFYSYQTANPGSSVTPTASSSPILDSIKAAFTGAPAPTGGLSATTVWSGAFLLAMLLFPGVSRGRR